MALSLALESGGLLTGVRAQQVMNGVSAREVLGGQAGPGQLGQRLACLVGGNAGQAGGGRAGDVRARVHAQQPEHSRRRATQTPE